MKRLSSLFVLSFLSIWMLASCEKEYSIEGGGGASSSVGVLNKDPFGGCLPINVGGLYKVDSALGAGNFVEVQVQVTTPGTYVISSDTVNGYYFRATGVFNLPGTNTVRLLGTGSPDVVGIDAFVLSYGNTECFFEVNVVATSTGGGGTTSSVGILNKDAFGDCLPINVSGVYKVDSSLGAGNFVEVQVQVTTPGTYVISSDTVNGYYFRATGVFNTVGVNTVRLLGTGRPVAVGIDAFVVSYGNSECSFEVNVVAASTGGGGGGTTPTDFIQASINGTPIQFNVAPYALVFDIFGFQGLSIEGVSLSGQSIQLGITKNNSTPITVGTYTVNQFASGNLVDCIFTDTNSTEYVAQTDIFATQNPAFTITITSITATRVAGTFSGPVRDNDGSGPGIRTFTAGTFNVPIQ